MPEFSNLLRQRLAAGERVRIPADAHPDADTLNAYAEQLLTGRERNRIVDHLSACNECREVVALSLPQAEEAAVVAAAAPAAGRRRFTWKWTPAFGLAASVATLALVIVVVIEAPHKQAPFASNQPSSVAPATAAPAASATPASAESSEPAAAELESARKSE